MVLHKFSDDEDIQDYIEEMAYWLVENTEFTLKQIVSKFASEEDRIKNLFLPDSGIVFSQDPAKFAEMLGVLWGWVDKPEMEFI